MGLFKSFILFDPSYNKSKQKFDTDDMVGQGRSLLTNSCFSLIVSKLIVDNIKQHHNPVEEHVMWSFRISYI